MVSLKKLYKMNLHNNDNPLDMWNYMNCNNENKFYLHTKPSRPIVAGLEAVEGQAKFKGRSLGTSRRWRRKNTCIETEMLSKRRCQYFSARGNYRFMQKMFNVGEADFLPADWLLS
jgi:hypothetical protein